MEKWNQSRFEKCCKWWNNKFKFFFRKSNSKEYEWNIKEIIARLVRLFKSKIQRRILTICFSPRTRLQLCCSLVRKHIMFEASFTELSPRRKRNSWIIRWSWNGFFDGWINAIYKYGWLKKLITDWYSRFKNCCTLIRTKMIFLIKCTFLLPKCLFSRKLWIAFLYKTKLL